MSRVVAAAIGLCLSSCFAGAAEHAPRAGLVDAKVFAAPGETAAQAADEEFNRLTPAADFPKQFARVAGAISRSKTLVMFEGHPRVTDRVAAVGEQSRRPSFSRLGQWFYTHPIDVSSDVDQQLRRAVLRGTKPATGGMKLCGGFHADYLFHWEGVAGRVEAQVCFSCHEVKLMGIGGAVYADLAKEQVEELRGVLKAFFGEQAPAVDATP